MTILPFADNFIDIQPPEILLARQSGIQKQNVSASCFFLLKITRMRPFQAPWRERADLSNKTDRNRVFIGFICYIWKLMAQHKFRYII